MEDYEGQDSNCCGAPIVMHDICSECKEHCDPIMDEEWEAENDSKYFEMFQLAVDFCEHYGYVVGSAARTIAVNAFTVGFSIGKTKGETK